MTGPTGSPLANLALAWSANGGDPPPEIAGLAQKSQDLLLEVADDALTSGRFDLPGPGGER